MVLRIQDNIESQLKPGILFSDLTSQAYSSVCEELKQVLPFTHKTNHIFR
jgi:hypothetical protein